MISPIEYERTSYAPLHLIRDCIDGRKFCYDGWELVMSKEITLEDIIGRGGRQSVILQIVEEFFYGKMGTKNYRFLGNECGNKMDANNYFCFAKAIYEIDKLPISDINEDFVTIAPKVVIELDALVDIGDISEADYVHKKIQKFLDYGTERVIWIFYESEKIIIAEQGKDWITTNWSTDFELLDGHYLNLKQKWIENGF